MLLNLDNTSGGYPQVPNLCGMLDKSFTTCLYITLLIFSYMKVNMFSTKEEVSGLPVQTSRENVQMQEKYLI